MPRAIGFVHPPGLPLCPVLLQDSSAHSAAQAFTGSIKICGLLLGWSGGAVWS